MPVPTATTLLPQRHQWHMSFDRTCCRNCGVEHTGEADGAVCKRAAKIRPMAGMRNPIKPDFSRHPKLKKAYDRWQADKGRA